MRCGRCGYSLATWSPGVLYVSPSWRPVGRGEDEHQHEVVDVVLELPPNQVVRVRRGVQQLRDGRVNATARALPKPYASETAVAKMRHYGLPANAALWWDRLPWTFTCPICATLSKVERAVLHAPSALG